MGAPGINGIVETAVYVDDFAIAHQFYGELMGLERVVEGARMWGYTVAPNQMLLIFKRGVSRSDVDSPYGMVPGHSTEGPSHFAFAIARSTLIDWREHLEDKGVEIRSEVRWPQGGISLFFDDPFGNVVELATPGLWPNYQD
ncbi:Metallothiol transferase FosB [Pseudovibrio axinellae]|uniref:Metallothiol transferase FosB n=1 Tax=Pseudovibrio axinellae TaxID=989403 RepID=A0A165TWZ4_9HYPH|nr:VOC family protein [Pseudovibrio axinellae]KZL06748.1 Metallothiol transferase FosB [Pseudovibrio axinellae]SER62823.1 Catechol 2,3-dioxygenase [Pseudovibrio axinellae]